MTHAGAIATALEAHFVSPDPKMAGSGVVLREVQAPASQRRIDVLAIALWSSVGYGIDAVEVKVDRRDFENEVANPAKSDPWWRNSNRFWIAAPNTDIANPDHLPPGWGLMVPNPKARRFKVIVKPAERQLEAAGIPLLATILGRHLTQTTERTKRTLDTERHHRDTAHKEELRRLRLELATAADPQVRKALDQLQLVEEVAGIKLDDWSWKDDFTPLELGQAIRTLLEMGRARGESDSKMAELVKQMRQRAEWLNTRATELLAS